VDTREASALIAGAIPRRGGIWADFGAGEGTFTRALAELLGPESSIYAVDRDESAMAALEHWAPTAKAKVIPIAADFTRPLELPGLDELLLDGMLLANTLHFVRDADVVLARLAAMVKFGGRVVFVEYDRRAPSRWVPYPISPARLAELATAAGLSTPTVTATRPSDYGGEIYVAAAERIADETKRRGG
jgi:ubiquinone/menaquinone biosynthesis C-methylase UbiE